MCGLLTLLQTRASGSNTYPNLKIEIILLKTIYYSL